MLSQVSNDGAGHLAAPLYRGAAVWLGKFARRRSSLKNTVVRSRQFQSHLCSVALLEVRVSRVTFVSCRLFFSEVGELDRRAGIVDRVGGRELLKAPPHSADPRKSSANLSAIRYSVYSLFHR